MAVAPVPLECELDVGPGRVLVVVGIPPQADPVAMVGRAVPELEEPDRDVPVAGVGPPRAHREVAMVDHAVPGAAEEPAPLETVPCVVTLDHEPVHAVDAGGIQ